MEQYLNQKGSWNNLKKSVISFLSSYEKIYTNIYPGNGKNVIDALLFLYKREMMFHFDLLNSYFYNETNNIERVNISDSCHYSIMEMMNSVDEDDLDYLIKIMEMGIYLPNAFSRSFFMRYFFGFETGHKTSGVISHMINFLFPLYEKAFFITLFECCKFKEGTIDILHFANIQLQDYTVKNLDKLLKNYINDSTDVQSRRDNEVTVSKNVYKYLKKSSFLDGSFFLNDEELYIYSKLLVSAFYNQDLRRKYKQSFYHSFKSDNYYIRLDNLSNARTYQQVHNALSYPFCYASEGLNMPKKYPPDITCPVIPVVPPS